MNDNMSLYKPDWKEARQRMADWWEGKAVDRAIAMVHAPIDPPEKPLSAALIEDVPDKYTDFDTVFNNNNYRLERTFWGGENFPTHRVYFGPLFSIAWLGARPHFTADTTWYEPCYDSIDDLVERFEFDRGNRWYALHKQMVRRTAEMSGGRYLVGGSGICAVIDLIAGLIGEEKLLLAMIDAPDKVIAARDLIAPLGKPTFDEMCQLADPHRSGVWNGRSQRMTQCDFSVMISPEMYRQFVLDDLESTFACVDYGLYHLDGEEQIRHLDMLLDMDSLRVIQWVPSRRANSPGYRDPLNWLAFFKRVQEAGKSLMLGCPPERVGELIRKIDRRKVILGVGCPDRKTADRVLRELDKAGW